MPRWDVFLSYAGEDRQDVVLPLAAALRRAGLRVWMDRQEIVLGDSLHARIDEGLAESRFGVVVLSPAFLAKGFPRKELDTLAAVEDASGRRVILPVWHGVDQAVLARTVPTLAGRTAASTADGMPAVAAAVVAAVMRQGAAGSADMSPVRLLHELLDSAPHREAVVDLLRAHPSLVSHAFVHRDRQWSVALGPTVVDLAGVQQMYTTGRSRWTLLLFGAGNTPVIERARLAPDVAGLVRDLTAVRRWVGRNLGEARTALPDIDIDFAAVVVAGRRDRLDAEAVDALRLVNRRRSGPVVRTYDWIIDAAAG